jgi:hypothetical protein
MRKHTLAQENLGKIHPSLPIISAPFQSTKLYIENFMLNRLGKTDHIGFIGPNGEFHLKN